jgi:hypothetical protein
VISWIAAGSVEVIPPAEPGGRTRVKVIGRTSALGLVSGAEEEVPSPREGTA